MKNFLIDEELANAILSYLTHRPYREVYQLVERLQVLSELPLQSDISDKRDDPQ